MRALIYQLGREDMLIALAVVPAAFAWILFESLFAGILTWTLSYAAVVGLYEYVAERRNWPHAAAAIMAKDLWRAYNPF